MKVKKYGGNELNYLKKVLNEENGPNGTWVSSLEKLFAEKFEGKYAIAMNSGTSTLHTALTAVGVGYGDEVISPALTVMMDTTTTLHSNAKPVYVDVNKDTFNLDPETIYFVTNLLNQKQIRFMLILKRILHQLIDILKYYSLK